METRSCRLEDREGGDLAVVLFLVLDGRNAAAGAVLPAVVEPVEWVASSIWSSPRQGPQVRSTFRLINFSLHASGMEVSG